MTQQIPLTLEEQKTLACGPRRRRDLAQEFEDWLASDDGQTVYVEILRRALRLKEAGWKHYSVDALVHAVRFDRSVQVGPDADGWKISDHHSSRLARLLMEREPMLAGFFETRQLRGGR